MNSNLVLVLVQYRFRCLNWSYFVIVLTAYESTGRPPGKKCNDFNSLAGCRSTSSYCGVRKPSDFNRLQGRGNLEAGTAVEKTNEFNRLSGSPELILNLPKFKNRKTPEGTALGHTGMNGPERANFISGCRANVRPEHAQLEEEEGLLVIVPTSKETKDFRPTTSGAGGRNKGIRKSLMVNPYNFNGLGDLRLPPAASDLSPVASLCNSLATKPAGRVRVLLVLVITLMEANQ